MHIYVEITKAILAWINNARFILKECIMGLGFEVILYFLPICRTSQIHDANFTEKISRFQSGEDNAVRPM